MRVCLLLVHSSTLQSIKNRRREDNIVNLCSLRLFEMFAITHWENVGH
jgi:hypothetical protein